MDKRFIAVPAALVMIALLGSSSSAMQPPSSVTRLPSHAVRAGSVPHFGHVFVLIGENTSAADVNSLHTPYIVNTLMPEGGTLTNYSALHGGSLSDYIGMTSGKFTQCDVNDDFPYNRNTGQPICVSYGPSLFHLLDKARISWTDWNESMPNPCGFMDMGTDWAFNIYATHHNPAVYYNDVEGSRYGENYRYSPNPECLSNVLPMGSTAPNDTSDVRCRLWPPAPCRCLTSSLRTNAKTDTTSADLATGSRNSTPFWRAKSRGSWRRRRSGTTA